MQRTFMSDHIQSLYAAVLREGQVFAIYAALAVFLGCLGLVGLSAATTERRTKEIGIRKAMGARNRDVLQLLVAELIKPVLWANAVAWPLGYLAMRRWLEGFAYHVSLEPWIFLGASALALALAAVTVSCHALLVARAEPVAALRYE